MHCQNLTAQQRAYIYQNHMTRDFPKNELKPSTMIERLLREGVYDCLGLYDDQQLVGYAYFTKLPDSGHLLLDYYAILSDFRNRSYGGQFLSEFVRHYEQYRGILIEVENPDYANSETERKLQTRRLGFYLRNGARETAIRGVVFSAHFRILVLEKERTEDTILLERMIAIYDRMTGPERRRKNVMLQII